jgi:glycosyltransferase involved in cell wall biosynthesis
MELTAGKDSSITLSVALVTRNRVDSLLRCLQSWAAQEVAPFEIVVSDDSDDRTAGQVRQLCERFNCIYTRGPCRGLYANRNHAALACRGSHILTADDDHTHPVDYLKNVLMTVAQDPLRVWIFAERYPFDPESVLTCPPELHRSGSGCSPADPSNCAAIADGSSVYPRQIFDQGLRYDESYGFGGMWYLWGKLLVKRGWRISFSDRTFIWHHLLTDGREYDVQALQQHLECNMYVLFVNAWWINPGLANVFWSYVYLLRHMLLSSSVTLYKIQTRLPLSTAWRLLKRAWQARDKYLN